MLPYCYRYSYPYKLPMLTISRGSTLSHLPRLRKDRLPARSRTRLVWTLRVSCQSPGLTALLGT
ncbi:hypothetical protein V8C42DRAFT_307380 [Trichoderma barbatum]